MNKEKYTLRTVNKQVNKVCNEMELKNMNR